MEAEKANYPITWMCRQLGVARSCDRVRAHSPNRALALPRRKGHPTGLTVAPSDQRLAEAEEPQ
jgi:hypothetical protein